MRLRACNIEKGIKGMKKRTKIILAVIAGIIICIGVVGYIVMSSIQKDLDYLVDMEIEYVDLTAVEDGVYSGSYEAFPVSAEVKVTVESHKIKEIQIISHNNGQGAPAEAIVDEVVDKGTLQVDVISGATYSSKVLLKAVENALKIALVE